MIAQTGPEESSNCTSLAELISHSEAVGGGGGGGGYGSLKINDK